MYQFDSYRFNVVQFSGTRFRASYRVSGFGKSDDILVGRWDWDTNTFTSTHESTKDLDGRVFDGGYREASDALCDLFGFNTEE